MFALSEIDDFCVTRLSLPFKFEKTVHLYSVSLLLPVLYNIELMYSDGLYIGYVHLVGSSVGNLVAEAAWSSHSFGGDN